MNKNHIQTTQDLERVFTHRLLVEGEFDKIFMTALLEKKIVCDVMGSRNVLTKAAQALHRIAPHLFFLIDRDHHTDEYVAGNWAKFPDPDEANLLIWRRKELENYLIEPSFFCCAQGITASDAEVTKHLVELAQSRVYYEAARLTLSQFRSQLDKETMNETANFTNSLKQHSNQAKSVEYLNGFIENHGTKQVLMNHSPDEVTKIYQSWLDQLIGDNSCVTYGAGEWLNLMQGKPLFELLFKEFYNSKAVNPNDRYREFSRDLLQSAGLIPHDLIKVKQMILKAAGVG